MLKDKYYYSLKGQKLANGRNTLSLFKSTVRSSRKKEEVIEMAVLRCGFVSFPFIAQEGVKRMEGH